MIQKNYAKPEQRIGYFFSNYYYYYIINTHQTQIIYRTIIEKTHILLSVLTFVHFLIKNDGL